MAGLQGNATVMVNTTKPPAEIRTMLKLHSGKILTLDATRVALENKSRLNMPMLAVLCDQLGFPAEIVKEAIAGQWPRAQGRQLAAYDQAVGRRGARVSLPTGTTRWLSQRACFRPSVMKTCSMAAPSMP